MVAAHRSLLFLFVAVSGLISICASELRAADPVPPANYDESQVPQYTLPDPLVAQNGQPITTAEQWRQQRRPELLQLFAEQMYGQVPPGMAEVTVSAKVRETGETLNGRAIRKQVELLVRGTGEQNRGQELKLQLLLVLPKSTEPVPAFVGLNFNGNHTISDDPEIFVTESWVRNNAELGIRNNQANPETRGSSASRWPLELIISRGYAVGTMYYGDIDPDFDDGFQNGIHPFGYRAGQTSPDPAEWGSIGAWAWGLSRILDYLTTDPAIDATRVAVIGHSRLGKTSLWAGATDERFALVISNNSGCGGAALSRRVFGESVHRINTAFPHWFCDNFLKYNSNEAALPFDQHQLIALMAPRPVYVASALDDQWADPLGEYLSCYHAHPVYRLLGTSGLGEGEPAPVSPPVDQPVKTGHIGYHIRTGKHDINSYDWAQYLDFADLHLQSRK